MAIRKLTEGDRPGEFLIGELSPNLSRENVEVSGGSTGLPVNAYVEVLVNDEIVGGVIFESVDPGVTELRAAVVRGPAEVSAVKISFPVIADDPEASTPVIGAEATAAAKAAAIETLRSQGIVVRD